MDFKQVNQSSENSTISSKFPPHTDPLQHQKWEVQTSLGYDTRIGQPFSQFQPPKDSPSPQAFNPDHMTKRPDLSNTSQIQDSLQSWDPHLMLSNLSFLEQKIHQLQDIIHSITNREGWFEDPSNELIAHQQLVTADITSIIIQLISTAGSLLPSTKNAIFGANPLIQQLGNITGNPTSASVAMNFDLPQHKNVAMGRADDADYDDQIKVTLNGSGTEGNYMNNMDRVGPTEEHDVKDYEDTTEGENLPPGSYEVLQLEKEEILAPHTHFCSICGKGFKRDANLRMHMRGHGDEYKTPAALSKPTKELNSEPLIVKRYSCPYLGCKRNKDHKKFQPLKTILCVKNHYKRSHCDKSYTCSRCNSKRFSVLADLKTHEKHCGRDKWLCSCGTTFSRKDKLFGHVALFQGHSPVLTVDELKGWSGALDQGQGTEGMDISGGKELDFGSSSISSRDQVLDMKGDDDHGYFSTMNFDTCNFGGIHELSLPGFEISESSFSFIPSGSCNFVQKNGEN